MSYNSGKIFHRGLEQKILIGVTGISIDYATDCVDLNKDV